eukprot:762973-Hanusia_phi.AAC.1
MFDFGFSGFELSNIVPEHSTALSGGEWHKCDDPWGCYLNSQGNPATNLSNPQGHTVYIPYGENGPNVEGCSSGSPCYCNGEAHGLEPSQLHEVHGGATTTSLGAGPEVTNCMDCVHNCVGGSEQGCIPADPPVGNASLTGQSFQVPAPAHWYANGGHTEGLAPTSALGAGPEVSNCMECPHNCVGGSETSCPLQPAGSVPAPAH